MPALMPKLPPMSAGTCSRSRDAQRPGQHRDHAERAVEIHPGLDGRPLGGLRPVRHHAVALHRHRGVAREGVVAADHVAGGGEGRLHRAEAERTVGRDVALRVRVQARGAGSQRRLSPGDGGEFFVVDVDEFGGLGRADDRGHAGRGQRRSGVEAGDPHVRVRAADDRGDQRAGQRVQVVEELALAAEQGGSSTRARSPVMSGPRQAAGSGPRRARGGGSCPPRRWGCGPRRHNAWDA